LNPNPIPIAIGNPYPRRTRVRY